MSASPLSLTQPNDLLRALYDARDPLYRETAHHVIDTGRPSVSTLVNMIITQLEQSGQLPARPAVSSPPAGR